MLFSMRHDPIIDDGGGVGVRVGDDSAEERAVIVRECPDAVEGRGVMVREVHAGAQAGAAVVRSLPVRARASRTERRRWRELWREWNDPEWARSRPMPKIGERVRGVVEYIADSGHKAKLRLDGGRRAKVHAVDFSWTERFVDLRTRLTLGQALDVIVTEIRERPNGREKIITSHRLTRTNPWLTIEREHAVGERVFGKVLMATKTYAGMELETGYPAILHNTEMSWSDDRPVMSETLKVGEWVETEILSIDPAEQTIRLSHRATLPDPWTGIEQQHTVGDRVFATVVATKVDHKLMELETGHRAMLRPREVSWPCRRTVMWDALKAGERVEVVILSIDREARRIDVSYRAAQPDPWPELEQRFPVGARVAAVVEMTEKLGVFARLDEQCSGLIHKSKLQNPVAHYQPGMNIDVEVVGHHAAERKLQLGEVENSEGVNSGELTRAA
jgi:small subunit ribosomal protein S1